MKSPCKPCTVALRGGWLSLCAVVCMCRVTAGAESTQDDQNGPPTLEIVTPYVKGEMPAAGELLAKCFGVLDKADSWTAKVTLRAAAPDRSAEVSYAGTLVVDDGRLHVSLHSSADREQRLLVLATSEQIVAWQPMAAGSPVEVDAPGNRSKVDRVARSIKLLRVVGVLRGSPRQLSAIEKKFQFVNKGVSGGAYVLEAVGRQAAGKPREASGDVRFTIGISVADALPTKVISQSADNGWSMVELKSIDLGATVDRQQLADKPPAGAIVIDLMADESPSTAPRNPIPFGPESVARGKRLYEADCVVCHSIDGTGRDSDVTDNATDLTDTTHWRSDGSQGATFIAIRDGAGDEMPGYKDDYRDERSLWDLVDYIRSLQNEK
jgi:mono/diheme cytochrome c family protein